MSEGKGMGDVLKELQQHCKNNPPQSIEQMTQLTRAIWPLLMEERKVSSTPILDKIRGRKERN